MPTVVELRKELRSRGLPTSGKKAALIARLAAAEDGAVRMPQRSGEITIPVTTHIAQFHLLNSTKYTGKETDRILMKRGNRRGGVADPRQKAVNPDDQFTVKATGEAPRDGLFFVGEDGYGHNVSPKQAQDDRVICAAMFPDHCVIPLDRHHKLIPVPLTYNQGGYGSCQLVGALNTILLTQAAGGPCLMDRTKALALYGTREESNVSNAARAPNSVIDSWEDALPHNKQGQYESNWSELREDVYNAELGVMTYEENFASTEGLHLQISATLANANINQYRGRADTSVIIAEGDSTYTTAHIPAMLQAFGIIRDAEKLDSIRLVSVTFREMLADTTWFAEPFTGTQAELPMRVTAEVDKLITDLIDLGRPVCVNMEGHTRAIVAYNDDFFCFADNWGFLTSTDNSVNKRLSFADGRKERLQRMYGGLAVVRRHLVASMAKDVLWVKHPDFKRTSSIGRMPFNPKPETIDVEGSAAPLEAVPSAATIQATTRSKGKRTFTDLCASPR